MTDQGQERLDSQLAKQIRSEITGQLARWVVATVAALIIAAALGWWFYLSPIIVNAIGVPPGIVAAFDLAGRCPPSWEPVDEAVGRTIVGSPVRPVTNTDQIGMPIQSPPFRQMAGQVQVTIDHRNLPSIPVVIPWRYDRANTLDGTPGVILMRGLGRDGASAGDEYVVEAGNQQAAPMANLPPYLALAICKKG